MKPILNAAKIIQNCYIVRDLEAACKRMNQLYGIGPFLGGAAGSLTAIALLTLLRALGGSEGLTPALPVAWSDILMLSPCPLVAATVALAAAHLSARRELARLGASQVGG